MELKQIKAFISVANTLNFTKSAEELFMTQSTVSKIIKSLEDELGTLLFYRTPKIELTEIGKAIYAQAINIVNLMDIIPLEVENFYELNKGEIKIGIPPLTGSSFFPKIIGEFNNKYPNVELQLFESGSKQIEHRLEEGKLDIGIMVNDPLKSEIYNSIEFIRSPLKVVINSNNPLSEKEIITFDELRNEKFVLFQEDFKLYDKIIERCKSNNFQPYIICKSSQREFIIEMVSSDVGVAFLPDVIRLETNKKNIKFVALEEPNIFLNLSIAWRKDRYLSHASREWIKFASEKLNAVILK
jgi:DNA-binding transcriptional LysR family regulator